MAKVSVHNITKLFGETVAVDHVCLEFPNEQLTVLVGPSGCGKTTLLRMLAGLEEPTGGEIHIGDQEVAHIPAWDRNIAMVFQSYALYPHMTVRKNISFPLEARKESKQEIRRRVAETAEILGLTELLDRLPRQLSGGQMQRVAIGRAIVRKPDLFLMDEPLSNLDAKLRVSMRAELKRLQRDLNVTTVYVTHDQAEAMTLADHLVVMNQGNVLQNDYPEHIYAYPNQVFVAGFIGSPGMNFLPCRLDKTGGKVTAPQFQYVLPDAIRAMLADEPDGKGLVFGVRPEDVQVTMAPSPGAVSASVYISEALGKETLFTLACDDLLVKACVAANLRLPVGTEVWMDFPAEAQRVFDGETGLVYG